MGDLLTKLLALLQSIVIIPLIWVFPLKWAVVYPGWRAVRFSFGQPSEVLLPGFYWATLGQVIEKRHTRQLIGSTSPMAVITKDGMPLRVGGVTIYSITNLLKYLTNSEDSEGFVIEAAEAALRQAIAKVPFSSLVQASEVVETDIGPKIAEICKELGIRVRRFRFQDIEIVDPIGRAYMSTSVIAPSLFRIVSRLTKDADLTSKEAMSMISPNVQFMTDLGARPVGPFEGEAGMGELDVE